MKLLYLKCQQCHKNNNKLKDLNKPCQSVITLNQLFVFMITKTKNCDLPKFCHFNLKRPTEHQQDLRY